MHEIAKLISEALKEKPHLTDVELLVGAKMFVKGPEGLRQHGGVELGQRDIEQFFDFVTEARPEGQRWRELMSGPKGDFNEAITLHGAHRLRVNGFYWGENKLLAASIRCQPAQVPDIDVLGVPAMMKFFVEGKGLVLVTGPTGSGKSTTLASTIQYMNEQESPNRNIITIEDPIEYNLKPKNCLIRQREVGSYLNSMHDGLVSALRQNPDVIMIGEIRDRETVEVALRAAGSGHLVLASMHTNNTRETIETILAMYAGDEIPVKAQALASRLQGIISQQLVPLKDRNGFALATELLIINASTRNLIRNMNFTELVNQMSSQNASGRSYLLNDDLLGQVQANQISKEDAIAHSYDPEALKNQLKMTT